MGIVVIGQDGKILSIHDDVLAEALLSFGKLNIRRASNVEFCNEQQAWFVDMRVDESLGIGAFRAGPFAKRAEALAWEVLYLEARLAGKEDPEASLAAARGA